MNCSICNNQNLEETFTAYFANIDNEYVIIENVPCYKCQDCGEIIYRMSTLETIEELLEKIKALKSKITIEELLEKIKALSNKVTIVDYSKSA